MAARSVERLRGRPRGVRDHRGITRGIALHAGPFAPAQGVSFWRCVRWDEVVSSSSLTFGTLSLLALAASAVVPFIACGGDKPANNPLPNGSASAGWGQPSPNGTQFFLQNIGWNQPPPTNTGVQPPPTGSQPPPAGSTAGLPGLPVDPNLMQQILAAGAAMMGGAPVAVGDPVDLGIKAA